MRPLFLSILWAFPLFGQGGGGVQFRDWTPLATTASPAIGCGDLRGLTSLELSVISAVVIPVSANAPEHCRVHLFAQPEINIEVNLPTKWNTR